jgi:hypothetical protein
MSMGEHDATKLVSMVPQVGEVGQDEIYPRHLLVREGHAGVDQHDPAFLPHGGHVFANLSQATQRYDL